MLSALVALLGLSRADYEPATRSCLNGLAEYWQCPGYSSYVIADGGGDRYYDDNAWVGMGLLAAYGHLKEQDLLDQARKTFDFVVSGWSADMGGGIYWWERDTPSKNTASNGPAIVFALQLFQATGDQRYLDWALKICAWLNARLRSPHGIYWDNLQHSGQVDSTAWTYNTGIMIQANALLYRITSTASYLDEARWIARYSLEHFAEAQDDGVPAFPPTPWFNAVLFLGYTALRDATDDSSYTDASLAALDRGWQRVRDENGLLGRDWSGRAHKNSGSHALLDEASVTEIYALAAQRELTASRPGAAPGIVRRPDVSSVTLHTGVKVVSPMGTTGSCQRLGDTIVCNTLCTGPLHVRTPIRPYYEQTGGPPGPLGFPVTTIGVALDSPLGTAGVFRASRDRETIRRRSTACWEVCAAGRVCIGAGPTAHTPPGSRSERCTSRSRVRAAGSGSLRESAARQDPPCAGLAATTNEWRVASSTPATALALSRSGARSA